MTEYYGRRAYEKSMEIARDVKRIDDAQKANQKALLSSFNRMADAIDGLAREVRAMREDLAPSRLDKPKLPTPEGGI